MLMNVYIDYTTEIKIRQRIEAKIEFNGEEHGSPYKEDEEDPRIYDNKTDEEVDEIVNSSSFKERKDQAVRIEESYKRLGMYRKSETMHWCLYQIEVMKFFKKDKIKIIDTKTCKNRLCPTCTYRKSLKAYVENKLVFDDIIKHDRTAKFSFLTLTVKNCKGENLRQTIDDLMKGFKKIMEVQKVKNAVVGYIRGLEVSYNEKEKTFHPHLHVLLHMSKNYFNENYIKQKEWREIWQNAMNLDYAPQVNIKIFKKKKETSKELAEISKYIIKMSDIINLPDKELDEVVFWLDTALDSRRQIGYGGTFKKIRKELVLNKKMPKEGFTEKELEELDQYGYRIIYNYHFADKRYKRKKK